MEPVFAIRISSREMSSRTEPLISGFDVNFRETVSELKFRTPKFQALEIWSAWGKLHTSGVRVCVFKYTEAVLSSELEATSCRPGAPPLPQG